jgi:hypothetical protein
MMDRKRLDGRRVAGGMAAPPSGLSCADGQMRRGPVMRAPVMRADVPRANLRRIGRETAMGQGGVSAQAVLPDGAVLLTFLAQTADPYEAANSMIDEHGRWARHVVLDRAIARALDGDSAGEDRWRRVLLAVLDIQTPRGTIARLARGFDRLA